MKEVYMKDILNSILMSFNMCSILPLPYAKWKSENMKYVLIFFPLVGVIEAFFYILVWKLSFILNIGLIFRTCILSILSIIYTGGIHFDGYLDTCDALGSNQTKEKKLEVLKDSHVGAYAIIGGLIYILIYFGAMTEIVSDTQIYLFALSAVLVRAYSTLSLSIVKNARGSGLAQTFTKPAKINMTIVVLSLIIIISGMVMVFISRKAIYLFLACLMYFIFHIFMAKKEFGGVTGDLCGHFFQMCELIFLILLGLIY